MKAVNSLLPKAGAKRCGKVIRAALLGLTAWAMLGTATETANAVPINITYTDANNFGFADPTFGTARKVAFEAAVDNWRQRLGGTIPIEINAHFESTVASNPGFITLAYAGPMDLKRDIAGLPVANTWYPVALANQLLRRDTNPPGTVDTDGTDLSYDIEIVFNADLDTSYSPLRWYYGLDANPPRIGTNADGTADTIPDFYSTAMHELGHGIGMIGLLKSDGNFSGGLPSIYDQYLAYGFAASAPRLVTMTAAQRALMVISEQLTFAGPNARAAQSNVSNVRLFAPFMYAGGSSVAHLDEDTYSGGTNELMTPYATNAFHDPGPVATGVFRDLGWGLTASNPTPVPTPTEPPNTGTGLIAFTSNRNGQNEIYLMNAVGAKLQRLTNNSANDSQPALSADGTKVAFVSNRDGNNEIYVQTIGSTGGDSLKRLTTSTTDDLSPSWNPAGTKLTFSSNRTGVSQIYSMNADGTNVVRLTNIAASDIQPAWSPNGSMIAFISNRSGKNQIYTMNADGSQVQLRNVTFSGTTTTPTPTVTPVPGTTPTPTPTPTVTPTPTPVAPALSQPAWNSASTKLAFIASSSARGIELYTMQLSGAAPAVRLTEDVATDSKPAFSPVADQIVYASDLYGENNLFQVSGIGSNRIRLTRGAYDDFEPSWSNGDKDDSGTSTPTPTPTVTVTPVPSATPPNNNIIAARSIAGELNNLTQSGTPNAERTNVNANKETDEPLHGGNAGGASVWYKWNSPDKTGNLRFSTAGSDFDTLLAVYTSNGNPVAANNLTLVAENNDTTVTADAGKKTSEVSLTVKPSTVYYIAVDGAAGATGNISLAWTFLAGPGNDAFNSVTGNNVPSAYILNPGTVTTGTNIGATKENGEPYHAQANGGASVWYKLTTNMAGRITIDTRDSTFDTLLGVYTGSKVDGLTLVASNDDTVDNNNNFVTQSSVTFTVLANQTYYVAVDGYAGSNGPIILKVSALTARQPDMKVRNPIDPAGTYAGDEVYSSADADSNQSRVQYPVPNSRTSFLFQLENRGSADDSFNLTAPAGDANFEVTYFDAAAGGSDITSLITSSSGWNVLDMAPGAKQDIRMEVFASANSLGQSKTLPIIASATNNSVFRDVAQAQVAVVQRIPDVLSRTASGAFVGDNVYNSTGTNQQVSETVAVGATASYVVRISNDGNADEKFVLTVAASGGNVSRRYYLLDAQGNEAEITSDVTLPTGFTTNIVKPGGVVDVRVTAVPQAGTPGSVSFTAASNDDRTKLDVNVLTTNVSNGNITTREMPEESKIVFSSASANLAADVITLQFSGPLDSSNASDKGRYTALVNGETAEVIGATYNNASQSVAIKLAPGSLVVGDSVTIGWKGLLDSKGRAVRDGKATLRIHARAS